MTTFYSIHFEDQEGYWGERFPDMCADDPQLIEKVLIPFGKSVLAVDRYYIDFSIVFECDLGYDAVWTYSLDADKPIDVVRERARVDSFIDDDNGDYIGAMVKCLEAFIDDCKEMGFDGLR